MTVQLNKTCQSDQFYIGFSKLPAEIQNTLKNTKAVIEKSRYTVYQWSAFIRNTVVLDDVEYRAEISLGDCDISKSDYKFDNEHNYYVDELGREVDEQEYAENMMEELECIIELEGLDVYLTEK